MKFSKFFNTSDKIRRRKEKISQDENKKKRSAYFGVVCGIMIVFAALFAFAGVFLLNISMDSLLFIFIIVLAFAAFACALVMFIYSVIMLICQFALNRSVWSWLALVFFIVVIAVCAVVIMLYIS